MGRTATTTRPASIATPTARVPVTAHTVALMSAAALGGAGFYALEQPVAMIGCAALGIAGSVVRVRTGLLENARRGLMDSVRAALIPVIGDVDAQVRAKKWTGDGIGHPRRIEIRYSPLAKDDEINWRETLLSTVERRLVVKARMVNLDRRRRRVDLEITPPLDPAKVPADVARAQLVISELFGPRAVFEHAMDKTGEQLLRVTVEHDLRVKVAMKAARMRIERIYSAMLPGRWRAKWDLEADTVVFELRPTLPTFIPHKADRLTPENTFQIPVAVDEDGNTVFWNLKGSGPHCMVVGKTGTGKTVCINGVAMEFARRGWRVWINDPKQIEFVGMRDWPNVQIVAMTVMEMVAMIKAGHDLMEERYSHIAAGGDEGEFEPILMVLDEYRNFVRLVTSWWNEVKAAAGRGSGLPSKCPVFDYVAAIAEKGRSAKVHILLGTQRPDAEFMTGGMRDNFDTRVSMGALSPQGAQMMWDSAYLGVAVPRKIRGRGTAINEAEEVAEIQVPWTPDPRRAERDAKPEDLQILQALRPKEALHPPLELDLGYEADLDGDGEVNEWAQIEKSEWRPVRPGATPNHPASAVATPAPVRTEPVDVAPWEDADVDDEAAFDQFEGYGEEEVVRASKVSPGELVQVDDQLDLWAVVTDVDEDLVDDSQLAIYWSTGEDEGCMSVSPTHSVPVRRMATDSIEGE